MTSVCRNLPFPRMVYRRLSHIFLFGALVFSGYSFFSLYNDPIEVPHEIQNDAIRMNDASAEESLEVSKSIPEFESVFGKTFELATKENSEAAEEVEAREESAETLTPGRLVPTRASMSTLRRPTPRAATTIRPCPNFVIPRKVRIVNGVWQLFNTSSCPDCSFNLLSAYLDDRPGVGQFPMVRVLMTSDILNPRPFDCLLWYKNTKVPVRAPGRMMHMWMDEWGNFYKLHEPYILSCPIRTNEDANKTVSYPYYVSLIDDNCDQPVTILPIVQDRPKRRFGFAVCAKALFFPHKDISIRLVEWFEALFLLGAHKIFIYEHKVHPNISKVLKYYSERGTVTVTPFAFPTEEGWASIDVSELSDPLIQQKRKFEIIPFNDCLYRTIFSHEYIAVLDTDEIIMPTTDNNWRAMLRRLTKRTHFNGFRFRNAYFMDDMLVRGDDSDLDAIPDYMHMLKHVYRAENFSEPGHYVKSITPTRTALVVHNHFPVKCLTENLFCESQEVNPCIGRLQHYRKGCTLDVEDCHFYIARRVKDTRLWMYKDALLSNVENVLRRLGHEI